jgi:hypothetical protein
LPASAGPARAVSICARLTIACPASAQMESASVTHGRRVSVRGS